ncbi:N-6 DNA methylase [Hominibacterium faecale]|uniref:N-6 DNA methylase n=1 Tax=Hominibacterium faecale TaxID=2839743 RepID=UPI0039EC3E06
MCYSRSTWEVWADLMSAMACSLSNAVDLVPEHYDKREEEYAACIKRLGSVELPSKIFSVVVMALENNPDQDFLGKMYITLGLGNHWKGQFFTPYSVCKIMAEMNFGNETKTQIEENGYISICDMTCGAGATLIATIDTLKKKINFQNNVLFVGQDIDRVVSQMCYIQLSLLGCAGYVIVGDLFTSPVCGPSILLPAEKEGQEFWYMPMFQSQVWTYRKLIRSLGMKTNSGTETTQKTVEKEHFYMYFDFKEGQYGKEGSDRI